MENWGVKEGSRLLFLSSFYFVELFILFMYYTREKILLDLT